MAQHDMIIADGDGATVLADMNDAFEAIASTNKGTARPGTPYAGQHWIDDNTPSTNVWTQSVYDGSEDIPAARIDTVNNRYIPYNAAHGQCRLTKSGANLLLSPRDGNVLVINGAPQVIPSAGVTLAPAGFTPDTVYYIYAYMSGTTMTLEGDPTGYAVSSVSGVATKSGDATRTLVGMVRPVAGPAFQDADDQRFVLSYFSRRSIAGRANFTANRTTTSGSYVELNAEIRNEFLTWGDEAADVSVSGSVNQSTANPALTALLLDGATNEDGAAYAAGAGVTFPFCITNPKALSEGYHYYSLSGRVITGGTATWLGGAAGSTEVTTLKVMLRG